MKKILEHAGFILFLTAIIGACIWFFNETDITSTPTGALPGLPADTALSNALATVNPGVNAAIDRAFANVDIVTGSAPVSATPRTGSAQPLEVTNMSPFAVLENMRTAIRSYGQRFGGNPVGNNEEITRALLGENPKQINFIGADAGLRMNGKGELIDAWGTPFFFHQLSAHDMQIRSAGPDKTFYTLDDLLTR